MLAIHFMFSSPAASYLWLAPLLPASHGSRENWRTDVVVPILQPYLEDAVKGSPRDVRIRALGRGSDGRRQAEYKSKRLSSH